MRYRWQSWPNPHYTTLHTDVPVPYVTCHGPIIEGYGFAGPTQIGRELADAILAVRGVEEFTSGVGGRYQITVGKGAAFEWSEVMPGVLAAVHATLDPTNALAPLGDIATAITPDGFARHQSAPAPEGPPR
jgi:hypothetical protein